MKPSTRHRRILNILTAQFDRPVMSNYLRGTYVECLVADLLGVLPAGTDWAPWDVEFDGARIEVKQSAARQVWHRPQERTKVPRFDIKARSGYFDAESRWIAVAGRLADVYIFAWHDGSDQRNTDEWEFFVIPTDCLPAAQKTIGLSVIRGMAETVTASGLNEAVSAAITLCGTVPSRQRR